MSQKCGGINYVTKITAYNCVSCMLISVILIVQQKKIGRLPIMIMNYNYLSQKTRTSTKLIKK